jgi:hypothetical protein
LPCATVHNIVKTKISCRATGQLRARQEVLLGLALMIAHTLTTRPRRSKVALLAPPVYGAESGQQAGADGLPHR